MSRFASASKALRGPFKRLVQKLRLLLKRPLIRRTPRGTRPPTTPGHAPTPQTLADQVAKATGGTIRPNKGGYTVDIPHGRRLIVLRVMDHGGARENYYRVSVAGKTMYTVTGEVSSLRDLTHIPVGESSMADILAIIVRIKGGS